MTHSRILAATLAATLACASVAKADERIEVSALPAAAIAAIEARFPGAKITRVERDRDGTFEVLARHTDGRVEIELSPEGAIIDLDGRVTPAKLPAAVTSAIEARFPGAEVRGAQLDMERGEETYELSVLHEKRRLEVEVTASGQILDVDR
ncbi:MAG: PepSY domain-containing protein [Opitutaceae bacterium]|jgi:hypothetical protein|nr:PepSY domain-containing protein [Opitutaceae bacterium]